MSIGRGLADTLKVVTFRYNQNFQEYDTDRFVRDLFNNPNVRYQMSNATIPIIQLKFGQEAVGSVEYDKMRCTELTLEIFDQLEKEGTSVHDQEIVRKGYISKMMTDYYEEIEICDKLRECLLIEESETYPTFTDHQRKELLMRIFQLLVIGGSFNQYEDMIGPYLEWTKKIYKALVSVRKRSETNEIFIESLFLEVRSMDKGKTFQKGSHPQNMLLVVVNPGIRTVHVVANEWRKFW
jgi:cilia- and flagella-associated protein 300